ncbi:hypothetical protein BC831DRAFT_500580 [Entophlyctis helioformis]|nr:hypothetical protein BC831DRAFT_500580 [Entophlyctis helioformis]
MPSSWIPLESNPEVMNKYLDLLGVRSPLQFNDLWGLDADMLQFIPRPVKAVVMLFPITAKYEAFREQEEARIRRDGQTVSSGLYFVRQTIGNACGTIGLLHALANNQDDLQLTDGPLKRILDRTAQRTPEERAGVLEQDADLAAIHRQSSLEGQTAAPDADDDVDLHFVCFVEKDGHVYEMDGRKPFPINHGPATGDLLLDAARLVRGFMEREPDQLNFTLLVLSPPPE